MLIIFLQDDTSTGIAVDSGERSTSHYVVATGIYEETDAAGNKKRWVEVSSGGNKRYVDYDKYIEITSDLCSNEPFSSISNTKVSGD